MSASLTEGASEPSASVSACPARGLKESPGTTANERDGSSKAALVQNQESATLKENGARSDDTTAPTQVDGGSERERGRGAKRRALSASLSPYNNCNEDEETVGQVTANRRRGRLVVATEVQALAGEYGIDRLLFVTFTHPENPHTGERLSIAESRKRWHSLRTGCVAKRYLKGIVVVEPTQAGQPHYHALCVTDADVRSGFDWDSYGQACTHMKQWRASGRKDKTARKLAQRFTQRYSDSATPSLRGEWSYWREKGPKYGFGRIEALPVRTNKQAIAQYIGGYLGKGIGGLWKKRARRYSTFGYKAGDRKASSRFMWSGIKVPGLRKAMPRPWLWRKKVGVFVRLHGGEKKLVRIYGARWKYTCRDDVDRICLREHFDSLSYPTVHHAVADGRLFPSEAYEHGLDWDEPVEISRRNRVNPLSPQTSVRSKSIAIA